MAVLRTTSNAILNRILQPSLSLSLLVSDRSKFGADLISCNVAPRAPRRPISVGPVRCAAASDGGGKVSARLSQMQQLLQEAEERALSGADDGPTPQITLGIFCN